jgi:hypothetical protein
MNIKSTPAKPITLTLELTLREAMVVRAIFGSEAED